MAAAAEIVAPVAEVVEEPFTLHYESGETVEIPWRPNFTIGDLWRVILSQLPDSEKDTFNLERVMLYDADYRRIIFDRDSFIPHMRFIRIVILENDRRIIRMAHRELFREFTATWQ